jgi:hypothetical protein
MDTFDRFNKEYKKEISTLLSIDNLVKTAVQDGDNKEIKIDFCGLAALTLLGGYEPSHGSFDNPAKDSFIKLINDNANTILELNKNNIKIKIRFLFAYPYSDFSHDLLEAELSSQDEISISCIKKNNNNPPHFPFPPKQLTYDSITDSSINKDLRESLKRLQANINNNIFNTGKGCPNKIIVKFTPINLLFCLLRINDKYFIDSYAYAKYTTKTDRLCFQSPISRITNPQEVIVEEDEIEYEHSCLLTSHFKYIWHHPLTLYCTDASEYKKGVRQTLSKILEPENVFYNRKAERLKLDPNNTYSDIDIDLWKHYCRNEFLKKCSKFSSFDRDVFSKDKDIKPIKLFIVGSWEKHGIDDDSNKYMNTLLNLIEKKLSNFIEPKIFDIENGGEFQQSLYQELDLSALGCIFHTPDILNNNSYVSKPNIYLEKGYLMGRLGRYVNRQKNNKEKVFVWKHIDAPIESDNSNTGFTPFDGVDSLRLKFFIFIKWIWGRTTLNNKFAIQLLTEERKFLEEKLNEFRSISPNDLAKILTIQEIYLKKLDNSIKEIQSREQDKVNSTDIY